MFQNTVALTCGLLLGGTALAFPFTITNETSRGNCHVGLTVEQDADGGYLLVSDFDDMVVAATSDMVRDFRHCTLTYDINLEPGFVVRRIDSSAEGYYSIADSGKVIIGVENRAVGAINSVNKRYSFNIPVELENIDFFVGSIHRSELPPSLMQPGATIGLNTKYTIEAVHTYLYPGETSARLTTATAGGSHVYPVCKIYVERLPE